MTPVPGHHQRRRTHQYATLRLSRGGSIVIRSSHPPEQYETRVQNILTIVGAPRAHGQCTVQHADHFARESHLGCQRTYCQ